jgi:hypothetical protein
MTGRKIKVPGYDWKKGKLAPKSTYALRNRAKKQSRQAAKSLRKGRPLI